MAPSNDHTAVPVRGTGVPSATGAVPPAPTRTIECQALRASKGRNYEWVPTDLKLELGAYLPTEKACTATRRGVNTTTTWSITAWHLPGTQ